MQNSPLLSVKVITFNQKDYIEECLNSMLNQKTTFPIEICIGDDGSNDGTSDIVYKYSCKYPNIRHNIHDRNNSMRLEYKSPHLYNWVKTLESCNGKYIAFLDGDDYWTDTYKLQKQVNFLEENPEFGMVHTDSDVLFEETKNIIRAFNKTNKWYIPEGDIYEELLPRMFVKTQTVVIRSNIAEKFLKEYSEILKKWTIGDHPIFLFASKHSKVKYFDYSSSVYRKIKKSATQHVSTEQKISFLEGLLDIEKHFIDKYGATDHTKKLVNKNYHQRKISIAFYKQDPEYGKASYRYLLENKELSYKDHFIYWGSKYGLAHLIISKLFEIKKELRILTKKN